MSEIAKQRLELIALVVSLVLALAASAQAWFTLPYRLEQAESAIKGAVIAKEQDRELLVRIDERLRQVQQDLADFKSSRKAP